MTHRTSFTSAFIGQRRISGSDTRDVSSLELMFSCEKPIRYHQAGDPDAAELWVHVVPHPDAASPDPLTHRQLQEEQGDADEDEEDEVGHQVRTWKRGSSRGRAIRSV